MNSALRLGVFYAAVFVGTGASLPYMPVWFRTHGLSGSQIGLLLAAPLLARAITEPDAPLSSHWPDMDAPPEPGAAERPGARLVESAVP